MLVEVEPERDEFQPLGVACNRTGFTLADPALLSKFPGQLCGGGIGHRIQGKPACLADDSQRVFQVDFPLIQSTEQGASKAPACLRPLVINGAATGKSWAWKRKGRLVALNHFEAQRIGSRQFISLQNAMRMQKALTTNAATFAKLGRRFFVPVHDLMLWGIRKRCNCVAWEIPGCPLSMLLIG